MQMMQNLLLEEGHVIHISSAHLPKGQLMKLQPDGWDSWGLTPGMMHADDAESAAGDMRER